MTEALLQYVWKFQYYDRRGLTTCCGQSIKVLHPGQVNHHQGPDFSGARVEIGRERWVGQVELHVRASDWYRHGHQADPFYRNVILQVVWQMDGKHHFPMPVLELGNRVSTAMLHQYAFWMARKDFIPCGRQVSAIPALHWESWKERLVFERLHRRSSVMKQWLSHNRYHWENTCWWAVAESFGQKVNAGVFLEIAMSIPFSVWLRLRQHDMAAEALLLGQAGLLSGSAEDSYHSQLQREYRFLARKHKLLPVHQRVSHLRMRPPAFPAVRLALLAALARREGSLFAMLLAQPDLPALVGSLQTEASEYWTSHRLPGMITKPLVKKTGVQLIRTVLINAFIPLLYTYGEVYNDEAYTNRAVDWLIKIQAEKNNIIDGYRQLGLPVLNAADSQALLELKQQYCNARRCLECAIGNYLLKRKTPVS